MKQAWSRILAVTLGAGLLWGGMALAKSPQQHEREEQHDGCMGSCKKNKKQCEDGCKKHAGAGASLCIKSCGDLERKCEQKCQNPGRQK